MTLPGFHHDVCASVHPLALASPAFRELDLSREGLQFAQPPLALGHPLDDGPAVLLQRDIEATAAGLGRDGPAWRRLVGSFAGQARLADAVLSPLDLPPEHPAPLLTFGALGSWPASLLTRAVFRTPRARALFSGLAAHAVLPLTAPFTAGFGLLLGALAHQVGWPVAVGGSQSLADALVARLRSLDGEVRTGTAVRSLADLPSAAAVVLDLTPQQVVQVAGDRLPPRYRDRLARFRYGPGVFKVDWALDGPVPWSDERLAGAGTVHLGGLATDVEQGERMVAHGGHPDRPYVLFVQATVADPTRAPAGRHTGWAYCHVPNGSTVDMTRAIEAQVERFAPGFRDRVLARHTMGPTALERHNANEVGGDIGGGAADSAAAAGAAGAVDEPVGHPGRRAVPVLRLDAAGRRGPRDGRLARGRSRPGVARTLARLTSRGSQRQGARQAGGHALRRTWPPRRAGTGPSRPRPRDLGRTRGRLRAAGKHWTCSGPTRQSWPVTRCT